LAALLVIFVSTDYTRIKKLFTDCCLTFLMVYCQQLQRSTNHSKGGLTID